MFRAHGGGAHTKVPLRVDDVPCPAIREFLASSASARGPAAQERKTTYDRTVDRPEPRRPSVVSGAQPAVLREGTHRM